MRILLVTQYFWPESFIINELVECLISEGHTIEVLTGKPNYPDGTVFPGYSARKYTKEVFNNKIIVHRVPIFPRGKGGARRMFLNYISFVGSGIFYSYGRLKNKQFDLIFVFALSPITAVIPAIYLKKRLNLPLAVWVQDLWPESLRASGFIKNAFLLQLAEMMVRWIYVSCDSLLVQSQAFFKPIARLAAEEKIRYYPNSYLDVPFSCSQLSTIPRELLDVLQNNFCAVFAGNIGTFQSLLTIVQAAEQLRHLVNSKIILAGSGSCLDWIKQEVCSRKLSNLIIAGRFPPSVMPAIFSQSSALLVTLNCDEIFRYTVPSKVQAYLAAGRPIIAALDGEGARIIDEAGAGLVGPAEDAAALAQNIERLYHMSKSDREKLGQSGRTYFLKHFEMRSQSKRLIEIFEEKLSQRETV